MIPKKNIHLFYGENVTKNKETITIWKEKFVSKYGDMNLVTFEREFFSSSIITDCLATGFMGSSRMIFFPDMWMEKKATAAENDGAEGKSGEKNKNHILGSETKIIEMLEKAPETNFFIFLTGKKPTDEIGTWLIQNGTLHDAPAMTTADMESLLMSDTNITSYQASRIRERLCNRGDFVLQESRKLALLKQSKWSDNDLISLIPDYREENNFELIQPLFDQRAGFFLESFGRVMRQADRELTMAMMTTVVKKVLLAATFPLQMNTSITPNQKNIARRLHDAAGLQKLYHEIVQQDIDEKSGLLRDRLDNFLMSLLAFCENTR